MRDEDVAVALQQEVRQALQQGTQVCITGGGSKAFLGRAATGQALSTQGHRGIISYDPRELVLTARAGTPLTEIEGVLAEARQMLAFEPPHFGTHATLGGTVASGLSGPARPYAGSVRDHTLGCRLIDGHGEILRFGGQVMKNVAGYDVSRLMVGAFGTLGVLLDVSVKVLPRPAASLTLSHPCGPAEAISFMSSLLSRAQPVSAAFHDGQLCHVRIAGSEQAVRHAREQIPGDVMSDHESFWRGLREQELPFFATRGALYRIMVRPSSPHLPLPGTWLLDWGGAQRWLISDAPLPLIRAQVAEAGGYVTQFRGDDRHGQVFAPLAPPLMQVQQRLKQMFDPHGLFNRGRLYAEM